MAQPQARAKAGPLVRDVRYNALPKDLRTLARRMDRVDAIRGVPELVNALQEVRETLTVPADYRPPSPRSGITTPTWFRQSPTPSVSPARVSPPPSLPRTPPPTPALAEPTLPLASPPRDTRIPPRAAPRSNPMNVVRPYLDRVEQLRRALPTRPAASSPVVSVQAVERVVAGRPRINRRSLAVATYGRARVRAAEAAMAGRRT